MIGITNAGGGGQLPFKIVGGLTQPSNPRDMTIWVKTSRPVTGWLFTSSPGAWADINGRINVVYKSSDDYGSTHAGTNCLISKPEGQWWLELVGCYQSNGSKLEQVTAYVWSKYNQRWRQFSTEVPPWDGYLYKLGNNQYTDHTGGWVGGTYNSEGTLDFTASGSPDSVIRTAKAVDLTNFNTLVFDGIMWGNNSGGAFGGNMFVCSGADGSGVVAQRNTDSTAWGQYSLDISSVKGSYYVRFSVGGNDHSIRMRNCYLQ